MSGPIRFVFTLIWFAIGLGMVGTLKDCTATMAGKAATADQRGIISYRWWNRQLLGGGRASAKAKRKKSPDNSSESHEIIDGAVTQTKTQESPRE